MGKDKRWYRLDNAAKIYPAARRRNWSNVFRQSVTLTEEVDVAVLQSALDVTVRRFPSIAVRLKAGVFWYYLQQLEQAPEIREEYCHPLTKMSRDEVRKCALRVIVYKNRIAVEMFHSLTDGNGALIFLKSLLAEYVQQRYHIAVPNTDGILDRRDEPKEEELEDSFLKYEGPKKASRAEENSFRIKGERERDGFKTNTTFCLGASEIASRAKELGVTIEFIEIDWDRKIMELDSKSIDVVWNGMTLTDAVLAAMECSNAYCNNAQVVIVKQ